MNLTYKELNKVSSERIYSYYGVSHFEHSKYKVFDDSKRLKITRWAMIGQCLISFLLMAIDANFDYKCLLGELEYFAFYIAFGGYIVLILD